MGDGNQCVLSFPTWVHVISFNLFGGIFENILLSSISQDEKKIELLVQIPK